MNKILKNFTLLYVEDDVGTVESIQDILEDKVKKLYVARDGMEGLEVYEKYKPDIILTDINMPKLNGIEMAKRIKEIDQQQSIIILTAFNENSLLHESVDIGVDGYITKPILDIEKMLEPIIKAAKRLQWNLDQKNLEHLLEVQGKTAAIGEMIGNIAHQWRQPLSVISIQASTLDFLMESGAIPHHTKLEKISKDIMLQTEYLSQTIDDFRDFLRADTSNMEKVELKNILQKAGTLVEVSMKDNGIVCINDFDECYVMGNENQMIQALINICNNAKDAILQNNMDDRYILISVKRHNNYASIQIKDSGGGIDEEIIDKIYEPYFTTKDKNQGTGIGLYMTFQTIQKVFNGTIEARNVFFEIENKKLKGAQFTITIPVC